MLIAECPPLLPPSPHMAALHARNLRDAGALCVDKAAQRQRGMGILPLLIAGAVAGPLLAIFQAKQASDLAKKAEKLEAKKAKAEAEAQAKAEAAAAGQAEAEQKSTTTKVLVWSGLGLTAVVTGVILYSALKD